MTDLAHDLTTAVERAMSDTFRAYTGTPVGQEMWNLNMERTWEIVAPAAVQAVRAAVAEGIAQTIGTERAKRVASACCEGTGYCGIDDCRSDAAAVDALDYAARIARAHGKEA